MSDVDFYWRCAPCGCVYLESQSGGVKVAPYPSCPACGEEEDVFRADDGAWGDTTSGVRDDRGSFVPSKGPSPWSWDPAHPKKTRSRST